MPDRSGKPLLVVVTGPPASGKTTLAAAVARHLRVPVLSKDTFKETLYEVFGAGESIEEHIESAGLALLEAVAAQQLAAGLPVIVESNFDRDGQAAPLHRLAGAHDVQVLQIHCRASPEEAAERFRERSASGRRHPGHNDDAADAADVARDVRAGRWDPLDLPGHLFRARADAVDDVLEWLERTTRRRPS